MACGFTVKGDAYDLDILMEQVGGGLDPRVIKDAAGNVYLLSSDNFIGIEDPVRLHEFAAHLLNQVNGATRVLDPDYRPVHLSGTYISADGKSTQVVVADFIEGRSKLRVEVFVDGQPVPPPPPRGPDYVSLAISNSDVRDALRILGDAAVKPSWVDLYKVFEIVRHAVGGQQSLLAQEWTSKSELSRFTRSAQHQDVSGDGARHARATGDIPTKAMSLDEAKEYILRLARLWIEALRPAPSPESQG